MKVAVAADWLFGCSEQEGTRARQQCRCCFKSLRPRFAIAEDNGICPACLWNSSGERSW